jgi:TetR/AcrR family transcriptional regulator, transcriptional repressor for nem operon
MTDITPARDETSKGWQKRERLILAARNVMYRQGVQATTLADIAEEADIPLGNVYYYFKTKEDVIRAVIAQHAEEMSRLLEALNQLDSPEVRLKGWIDSLIDQRDTVAKFGCPLGSLCSELGKRGDGLEAPAAQLMRLAIDWVRDQFVAMGREDAQSLSVALLASYQGIALLTNALADPNLLIGEANRLKAWIDSLS